MDYGNLDADRVWSLAPFALCAWPEDVISRQTLRALMPVGTTSYGTVSRHLSKVAKGSTGSKNVVTRALGKVLYALEQEGAIQRGEHFVLIRDRRILAEWAGDAEQKPSFSMLRIRSAIDGIKAEQADRTASRIAELRSRELASLSRLMEAHVGASAAHRGVDSFRPVPRAN